MEDIDFSLYTIQQTMTEFDGKCKIIIFGKFNSKSGDWRQIKVRQAYDKLIELQNKYQNLNICYFGDTDISHNANIKQIINYGIELFVETLPKCHICNLFQIRDPFFDD